MQSKGAFQRQNSFPREVWGMNGGGVTQEMSSNLIAFFSTKNSLYTALSLSHALMYVLVYANLLI